jgi:hypothetical protein
LCIYCSANINGRQFCIYCSANTADITVKDMMILYLLLLEHRLVWAYSMNQHEGTGDVDIIAVCSCNGQSIAQLLSLCPHPIQTFTEVIGCQLPSKHI